MEHNGKIRFFSACIICVFVLIYNIILNLNLSENNAIILEKVPQTSGQKEEKNSENSKEDKEKESQTEPSNKSEENTQNKQQSVSVNTEAVKGKIIKNYISPYTAPLSYNKVYLKNSTGTEIDIKTLLNSSLSFKIQKNNEPQVLILHTHATESFMAESSDFYTAEYTSRSTETNKNMVGIGEIIAKKLNDEGIKTLHSKTLHDYPSYSGSYTRSAKTVNEYLKKYPSIKIVLDLHRDAVSSGESNKVKLVTSINGKEAAQVMLVMGSGTGSVTNFPNWKENLKLALKLQQTLEVKFPTLARPLSLASKNYNQSLSKGALLIEFGTDANSLEEVKYSAQMVAESLVSLLNTL